MTDQPTVTLNDGRVMPQIGQGVFLVPPPDAERLVRLGLAAGYRAVDTAALYRNEAGVGAAVRASGATVFVTSKLLKEEQGYDGAQRAFERSFATLGLEWLDLYLIHWPVPSANRFVESWKGLVALRDAGRVRSIGVSNFNAEQLARIIDATGVVPAVNQIELHPGFAQDALVAFHAAHGIATTSWSPLGRGTVLGDPAIVAIAEKHRATPAQVIVAWHLRRGLIVIPKASSDARLRENLAGGAVTLDEDDVTRIATLDRADGRIGPDPMSM